MLRCVAFTQSGLCRRKKLKNKSVLEKLPERVPVYIYVPFQVVLEDLARDKTQRYSFYLGIFMHIFCLTYIHAHALYNCTGTFLKNGCSPVLVNINTVMRPRFCWKYQYIHNILTIWSVPVGAMMDLCLFVCVCVSSSPATLVSSWTCTYTYKNAYTPHKKTNIHHALGSISRRCQNMTRSWH